MKAPVAVLPIGELPSDDLDELATALKNILTFEIIILDAKSLPHEADSQNKSGRSRINKTYRAGPTELQFNAHPFMEMLRESADRSGRNYSRILGVTEVDLYTRDLNFIFGQARGRDRIAVVSTIRLKYYSFWSFGREQLESRDKYIERLVKEAVHELGHTFGLEHCTDNLCVMFFSNSLEDTDYKSDKYCRKCNIKFERFVNKL
jgi:archaemetzincin